MSGKYTIWIILVLVILGTSSLVFVTHGTSERREVADLTRTTAASHVNPAGSTEPDKRLKRDAPEPTVPVPLSLIPLMQIEAFEEDSGDLTGDLAEALQLAKPERQEVRRILDRCLSEFGAAELQEAEYMNTGGESFIRLSPCREAAAPVFQHLRETFHPVLGRARGEAVAALIEKQLRKGGEDPVEIGFVDRDNGVILLSKRTMSPSGGVSQYIENKYLTGHNFMGLARWAHLNQLIGVDPGKPR